MDNADIKSFRAEKLAAIGTAHAELARYCGLLGKTIDRLTQSSSCIEAHVQNGDMTNQEKNSELWHDLYNAKHQTQNLTEIVQNSLNSFKEESFQLIEVMSDLRPPKE